MNSEMSSLAKTGAESSSRLDLWIRILKSRNVRNMAEIGIWKGDFSRDVLKACGLIERYYMIDPWATLPDWNKPLNFQPESFDDVYLEAMQKTEFAAATRVVLRGRTKEVIHQIPDGSLDLAYIDGDHTLRGITIDLIKLWPKVKEGGLIGGDDFTRSPWQHDVRFEPTLVCPYSVYFAEAMGLPIVALPFNQFLIEKNSAVGFSFVDVPGGYDDLSLNKLPPGNEISGFRRVLNRAMRVVGLHHR